MKGFGYIGFAFILIAFLNGCSGGQFVLTGEKAYDLKQYANAPALLQKDFELEKDPAKKQEIAWQIADAYSRYNQYGNAEKWYKTTVDLGRQEALLQLGRMQMGQDRYNDAIASFTQLSKLDATNKNLAEKELKKCQNALEWQKANDRFVVDNVKGINTPTNDFSPLLNNGKLYFSSSRTDAKGSVVNAWTNEKNADVFFADKTLTTIKDFDGVNTDAFEGTCALSKDGNEIYFTRCQTVDLSSKEKIKTAKNEFCHVFYSKFVNKSWTEPEQINLFADTINVGQPALSKDGKYLFVSSDLPAGFGGKDLYYFVKTDSGWGAPYNAGTAVNTSGDEMFPWLDDRSNLYFSSNGLSGMGGLDIFKAVKGKTVWRDAQNLKSPINSGADDFGMVIEKYKPVDSNDSVLFAGYFSSNRVGGKGGDDIFHFEEKWVNYFVLKGKVEEKKFEQPENPDSKLLGMSPLDKVMVIVKSPTDSFTLLSNAAGLYTTPLKAETDYKLTFYKPGYFSKNTTVTTVGKRNQDSTLISIPAYAELDKIFPQKEIVIPNIYYDYNKATLRPESKAVLDSILVFFSDNKDLTIEIGSHTDSRGSDSYNEKLSQERAQSVVDYLIEKGVATERLVAKGYGETKITNKCINGIECTEEEHQKNRRTTFRIIGSKQTIESVQPEEIRTVPKEDEKK